MFRRLLQSILFIASLSIMCYGFEFSLWVTLGAIIIVGAVFIYIYSQTESRHTPVPSRGTNNDNMDEEVECAQNDAVPI